MSRRRVWRGNGSESYTLCVDGAAAVCALRFFFFNDTATTEIYTLSLHDALPIWAEDPPSPLACRERVGDRLDASQLPGDRSEEHTSELQSHSDLVCRLLLEKKKDTVGRLAARHLSLQAQPHCPPDTTRAVTTSNY